MLTISCGVTWKLDALLIHPSLHPSPVGNTSPQPAQQATRLLQRSVTPAEGACTKKHNMSLVPL